MDDNKLISTVFIVGAIIISCVFFIKTCQDYDLERKKIELEIEKLKEVKE
jgi:hypothetical protein